LAKRHVRLLERESRRVSQAATADRTAVKVAEVAATVASWTTARLLRHKRETFWQAIVDSERSIHIAAIMGRGRVPPSTRRPPVLRREDRWGSRIYC